MIADSARPIRKILVANRGEIALRVFHTCRELGIATVAVYSEADAQAPHRHGADEAVPIGPPPPRESYLKGEKILEAARQSGADAIHPGYGFLSEDPSFARAVEKAGFIFIGPTPGNIESMADKSRAREIFRKAGIPLIPGSQGALTGHSDLQRLAADIGFPLLVKAVSGGGGKGIRRVERGEDLPEAFKRAISEAGSSFRDSRVYLERLILPARHIEAQIFGDGKGGAVFYGERECSLQRNHQKVLEETPSPAIDDEVRAAIREAALAGVRAISYRGAGTIEFLYDEERRKLYFLEMNTRLQVEHPVTEMVTRRDLVAEQIRIAEGGDLTQVPDPERRGSSIEFRIYAEDPYRGFAPSTGTIRALRLPHGPFTRIDGALREALEVTPHYDSMLAKLVVWGESRQVAIQRLLSMLRRTRIGGIHTTVPLGVEICRRPAFQRGEFHTRSLEEWLDRDFLPAEPPPLVVRMAGIIARHSLSEPTRHLPEAAQREGGEWGRAARLEGTEGL